VLLSIESLVALDTKIDLSGTNTLAYFAAALVHDETTCSPSTAASRRRRRDRGGPARSPTRTVGPATPD
jgi:hypothetical protein